MTPRTTPNALSAVTLGAYFHHTLISELNFPSDRIGRALSKYVDIDPSNGALIVGSRNTPFLLDDDAFAMLTFQHERQHYSKLASTSSGLLLWRTTNSVIDTAAYIVRKAQEANIANSISYPLLRWYSVRGKTAFRTSPPSNPVLARALGLSLPKYRRLMPEYMDRKTQELGLLLAFLDAFNGDAQFPMERFLDVANAATQLLRVSAELKQNLRWGSRNPDASHYLPPERFTLEEIIEADARLLELGILQSLGASDQQIAEWERVSIFGQYERVFRWLLAEIGDIKVARIVIDFALMGPVDLICAGLTGGEVIVEDCLPTWRLVRAVEDVRGIFWPVARIDQEKELRSGIAERTRMPAPGRVVEEILRNAISNPESYSRDAALLGIPGESTPAIHALFTETQMRRAYELRRQDQLAFTLFQGPTGLKPLFEFHGNGVTFNFASLNLSLTEKAALLSACFVDLVGSLAVLAMIGDGDARHLLLLEDAFKAGLRKLGACDATDKSLPIANVKEIVATIGGTGPMRNLQWE